MKPRNFKLGGAKTQGRWGNNPRTWVLQQEEHAKPAASACESRILSLNVKASGNRLRPLELNALECCTGSHLIKLSIYEPESERGLGFWALGSYYLNIHLPWL